MNPAPARTNVRFCSIMWKSCAAKFLLTFFLVPSSYFDLTAATKIDPECNKVSLNNSTFNITHEPSAISPPLVRLLSKKDKAIFEVIQAYMWHQHGKVNFSHCYVNLMTRYINHYESTTSRWYSKSHKEARHDAIENVAWNPLAVFHLFNRFRQLLMPLLVQLDTSSPSQSQLSKRILEVMNADAWPSQEDLSIAAGAILRIQHVYDLKTYDVANGILDGEDTEIPLSASDCIQLGKQAMADDQYALAIEWFEEAEIILGEGDSDEFIEHINSTIVSHNLELSTATHDSEYDDMDPAARFFNEPIANSSSDPIRMRTIFVHDEGGQRGADYNEINYWGLCSGEIYQNEKTQSKLFCYLETKSNPFWAINPLKVELHSLQPLLIAQYHNLVTSNAVENLKSQVETDLVQSQFYEGTTGVNSYDIRSSVSTFVNDSDSESSFNSFAKIIELITGLRVPRKSEQLQVVAYATGSHYDVHLDAVGQKDLDSEQPDHHEIGDRFATFMIYLSHVVKGGATAFPQAGVTVPPIAGSAVLWFNVKRSCEIENDSWHASCPVILGEKWIANKWISSYDQMFHPNYQCVQDAQSSVGFQINGETITKFL